MLFTQEPAQFRELRQTHDITKSMGDDGGSMESADKERYKPNRVA